MRDNPVQFAVVREDPGLELEVLGNRERPARRALLVASGGCTALTLLAACPALRIVAVDPNPAQLRLVQDKLDALERADPQHERARRFGVGHDDPTALSHCGNFESLFRGLAALVHDLVAPPDEIESWFDPLRDDREARARAAFANRYWQVVFELFFADAMLEAMFTRAATQHAPRGSYPGYFRERIERGVLAEDAPTNRFVHHVLLGRYLDRDGARPPFLERPWPTDARDRLELRETDFDGVDSFADFDLIDLSNVLDWTDLDRGRRLLARIGHEASPDTTVLWRQLNNRTDRTGWLGPRVRFDPALDADRAGRERSRFYESVHCGTVAARTTD